MGFWSMFSLEMPLGQKENPWGPQVLGLFFLLPIEFFRYPVFLTHTQIVFGVPGIFDPWPFSGNLNSGVAVGIPNRGGRPFWVQRGELFGHVLDGICQVLCSHHLK